MAIKSVQYLGHSGALLTLSTGKSVVRVAIDPWLEGNPSCPESLYNLSEIDLICLTHGHSDHTASALTLAERTKAAVVGNYELVSLLVEDGLPEDRAYRMNIGGTITVCDLRITLTQAFHTSSYDNKAGKTCYAGEAGGFVIRTPDGESLYHAGDTALFSDMKLIGSRYTPRIALLPIGDHFTMGPEEAAIAVNFINPKVVIPIHWGTFGLLTGTPEQFKTAVKGESEVIVLKPGESWS